MLLGFHLQRGQEGIVRIRPLRDDVIIDGVGQGEDRGGEGVAADPNGNIYIANGQIFVYDRSGKAIGRIDAPERPIGLAFGGPRGRTLFVVSHHSLYSVEVH